MDAMPRPRPPFLHREKNRHGSVVWYVRRGDGPRIRIRGDYGSPAFTAAYEAAIKGEAPTTPRKPLQGTLRWLVCRYKESTAWTALAPATRRQRELVLMAAEREAGDMPLGELTRGAIMDGLDRRRGTPDAARTFLKTFRGLCVWASDAGLLPSDPTAGVKRPKVPSTHGFAAWTEAEIAAFERRWPVGTRERVWLDVLIYTGLRRGDAVRLGRQHVQDGVATFYTAKSGGRMEVTIPILPALRATLDAGPTGDLAYICGLSGQPLTKESFGNLFRAACNAAGVSKSAHGLRKAGATRLANAGATVAEIEAVYGWTGGRMASHYTATADRRRLAAGAISKLERKPIPAPSPTIPAPEKRAR